MKLICLGLVFLMMSFLESGLSKKHSSHECVKAKSCGSHDFESLGRAETEEQITLSFGVKLKNVEKLYQALNEVSDPSSENFGKHWTYDQVSELTSNSEGTQKVVKHLLNFVKDKNQVKASKDGTFVRVKTNIKTAEKILSSEFQTFKSNHTGELLTRTLDFELPTELSEVIDYVFPTIQFPSTLGKRSVIVSQPNLINPQVVQPGQQEQEQHQQRWSDFMTPNLLQTFYNISTKVVTNPRATQSVFAAAQGFSSTDLNKFQKKFGLRKTPVQSIVGTNDPNLCSSYLNMGTCLEGSLDVQYIMATAQKAGTTFWSTPVINFANWIEEVSSSSNPPLVHSISYGLAETHVDRSEQERFSQEAARLGLRGVTIVAASGDDGVSLYGARDDPGLCGFRVPFPANVPYVLSVGATMGPESGSSQEIACSADKGSIITTGGGFSTIFSRPDYQNSHVQNYLSNSQRIVPAYFPSLSMFNSNGRAIPDVAIAGNNFHVVIAGNSYQVSGTSASAPVFAGILTLANNERLNRGKSSLGFVNPVLYSLFNSQPSLFNDITSGDNRCAARPYSGGPPVCCSQGFSCASGWDPVTGLGSVNVGRLVEALAAL